MDGTSSPQSAEAVDQTQPEIPDGETYVIHGHIVNSQSGGGGYSFAPGYTMYLIEAADGRSEWLTLSTYQGRKYPCVACGISPPANQATSYGRDYWVLITKLHGHYVIRLLDEEYRH